MDHIPAITLIVSVYNNFEWLRLILDAIRWQSFKDFEVVIADDGSDLKNVTLLQEYISSHPEIKISHIRHEDKGWRKNLALNNAVRNSNGEYLVFIDGDCVPHPDFLYDHYMLRHKGFVIGGRRVESAPYLNPMMESMNPLPNNFFIKIRRKILANVFRQRPSSTLSQIRRTIRFPFIFGRAIGLKSQGILGANFGLYRSDFEKVNGFDERYVHPGTGEDCDIDLRLGNAGVKHLKASHYALMIHKCHSRLDWTSEDNARLYREADENNITFTPYGLKQQKSE